MSLFPTERENVTITYLSGAVSGSGYMQEGTHYHGVNAPVGCGLIVTVSLTRGPAVDVTSMTLSVDGAPAHFSTMYAGIAIAVWPHISTAPQTLTTVVTGGDGTTQGGVRAFSITGHDKSKTVGWYGTSATPPITTTMERADNALFLGAQQYFSSFTSMHDRGMQQVQLPSYSTCTAYWWNERNPAITTVNGSLYGAVGLTGIEIRRAPAKERRSRIVMRDEPWMTRPDIPVVDGDNPINRGLVDVVVPRGNYFRSLMLSRLLSGDAGTQTFGRYGPMVYTNNVEHTIPGARNSDGTWLIVFRVDDTANINAIINGNRSSGGERHMYFSNPTSLVINNASIGTLASWSGVIGANNIVYRLAISHNASRTPVWIAYLNGRRLTGESANTADSSNPFTQIVIGDSGPYGHTRRCSHAMFADWSYPMEDEQLQTLSENPFQIFAPQRRTIFTGTPVLTHKRRRVL